MFFILNFQEIIDGIEYEFLIPGFEHFIQGNQFKIPGVLAFNKYAALSGFEPFIAYIERIADKFNSTIIYGAFFGFNTSELAGRDGNNGGKPVLGQFQLLAKLFYSLVY
jgi:hypothetical protein